MDRRRFLKVLGVGAGAAAIMPEALSMGPQPSTLQAPPTAGALAAEYEKIAQHIMREVAIKQENLLRQMVLDGSLNTRVRWEEL